MPPRVTSTGFRTFRYSPGNVERAQPRLVNEDHEGSGTSVEDRDLGPAHLDAHVVHPEGVERRKEVLHGVDGDAVVAQGGGVVLAGQVSEGGGDLDAHVDSDEADAVLGGGGQQAKAHGLARVQADAGATHGLPECSSVTHRCERSRCCRVAKIQSQRRCAVVASAREIPLGRQDVSILLSTTCGADRVSAWLESHAATATLWLGGHWPGTHLCLPWSTAFRSSTRPHCRLAPSAWLRIA